MNLDKNLIAKNFSRGSKTYDEVAQIQRQSAQELVASVLPYLKKDARILDLGSGTSFVAKEILKSPGASRHPLFQRGLASFEKGGGLTEGEAGGFNITEVDLSLDMLQSWRNRPSNVKAIQADIEKLPFVENSFDVIISSFALQWIVNFEKNFSQFFALLKPNGVFAFCLPTHGSMPEFTVFNLNKFPTNETLKTALKNSGFEEKIFVEKNIQQEFATKRDVLKFLKRIGADSPQKTKLPLKISVYKNVGTTLSWRVSHFISIKNDR